MNERSTFGSARGTSLHGREIKVFEDEEDENGLEDRFIRASPMSS